HICPVCSKLFATSGGRNSHLKTARSCSWYRRGKLRALDIEREGGHMDIQPEDTDHPMPHDDHAEWDAEDIFEELPPNDIFHFLPLDPQPSGSHTTVYEEVTTSGQVIWMNATLHDRWKKHFSVYGQDKDGDIDMAPAPEDDQLRFHPFASQLDWQIAHWFVKEQPSHKSFDHLLQIPGVQESLGLSYNNVRSLHEIVDSLPERAGKWFIKTLSFQDRPEEKHVIHHRDVIAAIRCLWGDPSLATKYLTYKPCKVFSGEDRKTCIYSEMWTGVWWHAIQ
ncbi:hypothetical protein C8Q80DRAFT_1051838, partial [Daedaleopsis nitida]